MRGEGGGQGLLQEAPLEFNQNQRDMTLLLLYELHPSLITYRDVYCLDEKII